MARKFLTHISMENNNINNVAIHPAGTSPAGTVEGLLWYDNTAGVKDLKVYNGTAWVRVGSSGTAGVSSITGTANQITASASTGAVTLSLPSAVTMPGSLTVTTDLTVTGNLTVSGTTTTVNSETLTINDNVIVLNNNVTTGVPSENGGIEVRRGGSTNASLLWDEANDLWKAGLAGAEVEISLLGHTHSQYATLASPTFTGTPAAPTAAVDTNTTQVATTAFVLGQASSTTPVVNGTAAVGTSVRYARADHVHGTDTSRAPLASPAFTGTPTAPTATAGTNSTQVATTAYVDSAVTGVTKKYAADNPAITIASGVATWTATHNLGTRDINVTFYTAATPWEEVDVDIEHLSTTQVTLRWNASANVTAATYRLVVIG